MPSGTDPDLHPAALSAHRVRPGFTCQVTGASPRWAAILAAAYVSRALYAAAYIGNIHALRSSILVIGFGATFALKLLPMLG